MRPAGSVLGDWSSSMADHQMVRVYLASPLGFAHSTLSHMDELVERLSEHTTISNPWDDKRFEADFGRAPSIQDREERLALYRRLNTELGRANVERIDACDGVIAVLDGVDVDSGTASEIGYAFAGGKRIYGLRTDFRLTGDNEGSHVNLQVQYFIEASGGCICTTVDDLVRVVDTWTQSTT